MHRSGRDVRRRAGFPEQAGSHRRAVGRRPETRHHGAHGWRRRSASARPAGHRRRTAPAQAGRIGTEAVAKSRPTAIPRCCWARAARSRWTGSLEDAHLRSLKDFVAVADPVGADRLTVAPKTPAPPTRLRGARQCEEWAIEHRVGGQRIVEPPGEELLIAPGKSQAAARALQGSGPALTDLIGSRVESMMDQLTPPSAHREGRIRALAILSLKRSPLLPMCRRWMSSV